MNKVVIYLKASKEAYLGVLGGGLEGEKWCKYIITSIRKEKNYNVYLCHFKIWVCFVLSCHAI